MKILQICFRMPYPLKDGGAVAMHNMTKGFYENNVDVTVLYFNTPKHTFYKNQIPDFMNNWATWIEASIDTRIKPLKAFFNLFTSKSYNIERFRSSAVSGKLKKLLSTEKFDIIHFEGLYTSLYIDLVKEYAPESKTSLRQHNIEYKIWERLAQNESGVKKWYLQLLAGRLKKFEKRITQKFDLVVPITKVDEEIVKGWNIENVFTSSTGVDLEKFIPNNSQQEDQSVFHLGSLDWMPNQQGLKWFLDEVWPQVHAKNSLVKFYVAGRSTPEWVRNYHQKQNVIVSGEVPDAVQFMNSKAIMVIPLRSGSGMRIKLIEGMSLGKSIVTTSIGAEGVDCVHQKHVLVANSGEEFASAILELLKNKPKKMKLEQNACILVEEKYNNKQKVVELLQKYQALTA